MNLTRVPALILVIGVVLCSLEHARVAAQAPRQVKLWAAISATQPVFQMNEVGKLQISFGVVNDGDTVANPLIGSTHLFINGAEPKDWGLVINNGIRTEQFTALPPGQALSFGYQLGSRYFAAPGVYAVRWVGQNFRSPEITFRVMPSGK